METICPRGELLEYCEDTEFELSSAEDGQKYLAWQRTNHPPPKPKKRKSAA